MTSCLYTNMNNLHVTRVLLLFEAFTICQLLHYSADVYVVDPCVCMVMGRLPVHSAQCRQHRAARGMQSVYAVCRVHCTAGGAYENSKSIQRHKVMIQHVKRPW